MKHFTDFIFLMLLFSFVGCFSIDKLLQNHERKISKQRLKKIHITKKGSSLVKIKKEDGLGRVNDLRKKKSKKQKSRSLLQEFKLDKISSLSQDINELDDDLKKLEKQKQERQIEIEKRKFQ